jgi:hypothetical protein
MVISSSNSYNNSSLKFSHFVTRATVTSKYAQQQNQQQKQQQHQQQQQPQQQQLWQSLSMYSQLVVAPATQVEVAHEVASARQLF